MRFTFRDDVTNTWWVENHRMVAGLYFSVSLDFEDFGGSGQLYLWDVHQSTLEKNSVSGRGSEFFGVYQDDGRNRGNFNNIPVQSGIQC